VAASPSSTAEASTMNQLLIPGLTSEQVQRLISLIEPSKPENEKLIVNSFWMLDSGAVRLKFILQVYGVAVTSNRQVRVVTTGNLLPTSITNLTTQCRPIKS